jgi:hypothetical protein
MRINSIDWHKTNLKNHKKYHYGLFKEIQTLRSRYDADSKELDFYELQIDTAFSKGKDSFDRDKYLVKRNVKK